MPDAATSQCDSNTRSPHWPEMPLFAQIQQCEPNSKPRTSIPRHTNPFRRLVSFFLKAHLTNTILPSSVRSPHFTFSSSMSWCNSNFTVPDLISLFSIPFGAEAYACVSCVFVLPCVNRDLAKSWSAVQRYQMPTNKIHALKSPRKTSPWSTKLFLPVVVVVVVVVGHCH